MEGMSRLGYAAANVGEREVLFDLPRLQGWLKKEGFPLLSANLVYQDSGQAVLQTSLARTIESTGADGRKRRIRVGIFGLTRMNPGLSATAPDGRRIVTVDPVAAAKELVPALRKKSDLVLAMVTLDPEAAKALVQAVPGIDVVLGGFGPMLSVTQVQGEGSTGAGQIVYAGNQGKKLGEIRVFLGDGKTPPRYQVESVNLGRMVPDDPEIMDLVDRNRIAINEIRKRDAPAVDPAALRAAFPGATFVQAGACQSCHEEEYRLWQSSSHAHAFKILEEKHQDFNPDCVGCHTTGFRRPTGFLNAKSTPELANVQCEACHGPGKNHPDPQGAGYGPVGGDFCVTCHTVDNSPDFDPVAYRAKIRHWPESKPPAAGGAPGR